MEYRELIDAFAAKCGIEHPGGEDGVGVFEIDGMTVQNVGDLDPADGDALYVLLGTVGTMVIYIVINWAVSTLMEGKGNLKKIFCASCYALQPLMISSVLFILLSYVIIPTGNASLNLMQNAFQLMFVVRMLLSITVIHDFSFFKAIGGGAIILVGMGIAIFIIFIMLTLGQNLVAFILGVIQEAVIKGA